MAELNRWAAAAELGDVASKWINRLAIGALGLAALSIVGISLLYSLVFRMNDGPFHGRAAECPTAQPTQELPIGNNRTLRVYDAGSDGVSPIVTMSLADRTLWCIHADAYPKTRVDRIEFHRSTYWPLLRRRVVGLVQWTYGREATWWFIRYDGSLQEYWYSW